MVPPLWVGLQALRFVNQPLFVFSLTFLLVVFCVMSVSKDEEVSDLNRENNKQLMNSFKNLLAETVGEIKRSHKDSAEQQMKEFKISSTTNRISSRRRPVKTSSTLTVS